MSYRITFSEMQEVTKDLSKVHKAWYWFLWILGILLAIVGTLVVAAISVFFTLILPILIVVWIYEKVTSG